MRTLWMDVRYAARILLASPGFSLTAILTLGLGIAGITVVFSMANAYFLRPLPFKEPSQLVHIWATSPSNFEWSNTQRVRVADFNDWRAQSEVFEDMGGYYYTSYNLTLGDATRKVRATRLTPNLFRVLGVNPIIGRTFLDEEGEPDRGNVAVLSHHLWQSQFNADPGIENQSIELDGSHYTVVGVMPKSFVLPFNSMDMWLPLDTSPYAGRSENTLHLLVIGRLKPRMTPAQAQTELDVISSRLEQAYPVINAGRGANVVDLRSQLLFTYDIFKVVFPTLFLALGFVMLIVCANLGNLLLAKGASRAREIAVRAALGATRARLIQQLLTEGALLALAGGALGVLLASAATGLIEQNIPGELYRVGAVEVDLTALGLALALSLGTVALFGLAPALQSTRPDLTEALKQGGRGASGGVRAQRLRNVLVVVQVALAMTLVAGAALMVQTFMALQAIDTGFNPDNLLTMEIVLPRNKYPTDTEENLYYDELLRRANNFPGVKIASTAYPLVLNHESLGEKFEIEGRPPASPEDTPSANTFWVTPGYFKTMEIPLLRGRMFDSRDTGGANRVILLNERMAEKFFRDEDPLGRRLKLSSEWWTVAGIVADSVAYDLDEDTPVLVYFPQAQFSTRRRFLMVRTAGAPMDLAQALRTEIQQVDSEQPITNVRSMNQVILMWLGPWMIGIGGISTLGFGALFLAAMGLYGVIAFSVTQRTHEFGIRLALGAQGGDILRLVLRQSLFLTLTGAGIGMAASLVLTRFLQSLLFGVTATNPIMLLGAPAVLCGAALLASYLPARRATRVDPMVALRYE